MTCYLFRFRHAKQEYRSAVTGMVKYRSAVTGIMKYRSALLGL